MAGCDCGTFRGSGRLDSGQSLRAVAMVASSGPASPL